jgi:Ala-tRNA(Pro) deacylase
MAEGRGDCNREIAGFLAAPGDVNEPSLARIGTQSAALLRNGLVSAASLAVNGMIQTATTRSPTRNNMPKTEAELFAFLADLGIEVSTLRHPPLFTVADSQALRGEIAGGHTKNLFLKDKKDNFFLVSVGEEAVVDLKQIHNVIGAAGRVSFGKPEMLMELLGVVPGAVTVFGLINDTELRVKVVLDQELMGHAVINAHPLTNEATTSIAAADLVKFVEATGHDAVILKVTA